jgi:NAD(P)-dependent dehydrogenase (short-subunit alcohol dehydrogenase family)
MELADQTALITGGTAGIGLACAELLAREGASVIITGRDEQRSKSAAAGIDGSVRFVQADLSDIESVESLIRTWAAEFGACVRVNSVAPGPTKTEGVEAEWGETNEELGRALPLGRTAEPEEIAHAVLFLASPQASFITGSTLHADGGGSAI